MPNSESKTSQQLKSAKSNNLEREIEWIEALKVILCLLVLLCVAYWGLTHSPKPKLADTTPPHIFSSERAFSYVRHLVDNIGYRLVGSKGLEQGQQYIVEQLEQMVNRYKEAHTANNLETVLERQVVNGTYRIKLESLGNFTFHTVYTEIENIIFRIQPKHLYANSRKAVLVNCHVDSAVGSPGASDDAAGCGVMLELVNNILSGSLDWKRPIIFLFNGAEEPVLDGAHGFVTQHRWAKDVGVLLNIESSGSGGLALLFRSGPKNGWLTRVFAKSVKRPHGASVSQDFFDADLVPAETDFRVFWEQGNIPGIDLANYLNGQTYHTPRDASDRVMLETLQHMGETVNSLLVELAVNSNVIDEAASNVEMQNERVIYHDFLGLYTFIYSERIGNTIFWLVWLISIYLCVDRVFNHIGWKTFVYSFFNICTSIAGAFGAALVVGFLLSVSYIRAMVWYHRNWVAYFIFAPWMTCVFLYILNKQYGGKAVWSKKDNSSLVSSEALIVAHVVMEWIVLTFLLYFRLASVYIYAWTVIAGCLAMRLPLGWTSRFICLYIPIAILKGPVFWLGAQVFLPIMGRAGVNVFADVVAVIFVSLFWIPSILIPLAPTWVSMFLLLVGVFHPYDKMNAPKRVVYHHMIVSENNKVRNALFVSSMDRRDVVNAPYSDVLLENAQDSKVFRWGWFSSGPWENIEPLGKTCHGVFIENFTVQHDVPKPSVKVLEQRSLTSDGGGEEEGRELLLEFSFPGAHWGSIRWNASLSKWSLEDKLPEPLEDGTVYMRHIGSHDSRSFQVRLHTRGKAPIAMDLTSTHFGAHSDLAPFLTTTLPNWAVAIAFRSHAASCLV
ncbi:hypothetical protein GAYE_SCF23G4296 [Galdieria yellowstonensis]|uniref:Peptidase M28 domain-containing protein n=1 Tax=Galdieria yellowstonensis TaxID=3028027 RepID=A0AAV9IG84_9RHOD|nr:hypothetical protein GAYE_SCF23G4296 [Galdieria yellowstonensis]